MTTFVFERTYPFPTERVFAVHENPSVLGKLQDPGIFRLIRHDGHIRPGARTEVRHRMGPFWVRFVFEHDLHDPPRRFGERLVEGPFRRMVHVHEFEPREGGTLVRDRLEIELPWWMGGVPAERCFAAPKIRALFAARQEAMAKILAGSLQ